MSTKIYNGYKLPSMSAFELKQFIDGLREKLQKKKDELVCSLIAGEVVYNFDHIYFGIQKEESFIRKFSGADYNKEISEYDKSLPNKYSLYSLCLDRADELYGNISKTSHRNPTYDFQFIVCFIPQRDCILAIIYNEKKEYREIWEEIEGVEYFGYWDNTDPMEGFSWEDWKKRGETWDEALNNHEAPGRVGFSWEFLNPHSLNAFLYEKVHIFSHVPTLEQRIKNCVDSLAIERAAEFLKQEGKIKEDEKDNFSIYFSARDFLRDTEEGKKIREEIYQDIANKIKKEITIEDFSLNYKQIKELNKENGTGDIQE